MSACQAPKVTRTHTHTRAQLQCEGAKDECGFVNFISSGVVTVRWGVGGVDEARMREFNLNFIDVDSDSNGGVVGGKVGVAVDVDVDIVKPRLVMHMRACVCMLQARILGPVYVRP